MGRLIFVNRFYWPETPATGQLLADLATALASDGCDVRVITSQPTVRRPAKELHEGVTIVRAWSVRWGHGSVAGKALAFISFAAGALGCLWREVRRGDLIVAMTDPPLLGVIATWMAELRGAHVVHWIQDIYPEVAVAISGQRWLQLLAPFRNVAWRTGDHCVTLSQEMAAVVAGAGVDTSRITIIANWPPKGLTAAEEDDPAVRLLRQEWHLDDKILVMYSGNLGRVHDLEPVLDAAARLSTDPRVAFVFVGGGPRRGHLETQVKRLGLENVHFVPPQSRDRLRATLAAADMHLVTVRPGCESYVFPSKLYGIAAVGRPAIVVGPPRCELARLVAEGGLGLAVDRNDVIALAEAIANLANDPAQRTRFASASAQFGRQHDASAALNQWRKVIHGSTVAEPRDRP